MNEQTADFRFVCGVDVGGTFTDVVMIDRQTRRVVTHKLPTTPKKPAQAILEGVSALLKQLEVSSDSAPVAIIHATTLVTNALIERRGARIALLTTKGFADTLDLRRENRFDIFDLALKFPEPLAARSARLEIDERMDVEGRPITVPNRDDIIEIAKVIRAEGYEAVAICFLHSYKNPEHERVVADIVRAYVPYVCISSDISPIVREYERTSTATLNAYVMPIVDEYLSSLEGEIRQVCAQANLSLMVSNGGICAPDTARKFPVRLLESGPVAGALVAGHYAAQARLGDLLAFDMGGTTAKLCVLRDGAPAIVPEFEADRASRFRRGSGLPVLIPSVDLVEIGAGGGSIAGTDGLGLLQVGPQSSGAEPGPACYGRGGTDPTVTDANLVLGYLNPGYFLGGRMSLDPQAAARAIETKVASPIGADVLNAAWGIHDLVNENMSNAAWLHMAEKGLDPRRFVLVATGGASALHACQVAAKLGISHVICPPSSGVASAFGLIFAPPRADVNGSFLDRVADLDLGELQRKLNDLENQAANILMTAGLDRSKIVFERYADMLYQGQTHHVEVALPDLHDGEGIREQLLQAFKAAYATLYGANPGDVSVQIAALRVAASAQGRTVPDGLFSAASTIQEAPVTREAYCPKVKGMRTMPAWKRSSLIPELAVAGPALIESPDTTLVVPDGWQVQIDTSAVLHIRQSAVHETGMIRQQETAHVQ